MIGHPDEHEPDRWASADLVALRHDSDDALQPGTAVSASDRLPSDAALVEAVRHGAIHAYGELYGRHVSAARRLARSLVGSGAEADDLVSDAFAKVLDALRAGRGPDSEFRAYLLTALRHTAYDKTRRDKRVKLADDVEAMSGVEKVTAVPFHDPAVATLERSLASRAFASLPERWQAVLWQTEVEGQSAAELASLLGLTANGAAALAYRAREGLKRAYLQAHLTHGTASQCRTTAARLGRWTRGGLTRREAARVEAHLDGCAGCRGMAAELADVNGMLRAFIAPLALGSGTAGYLAATAGAVKAGGTGAVTGTAGAAFVSAPQWLGVAASATAVVMAVAWGLNTEPQAIAPTPDARPPTSVVDRQAPGPTSATPPVSLATSTGSTSTASAATTTTTAGDAPPGTGTASTGTAAATVDAPDSPLLPIVPDLLAVLLGGPALDVTFTVRNTGSTPAQPLTLVLSLPDGVTAVSRGTGLLKGPLTRTGDAADQTVGCPAGEATVTCTAKQELPAGASARFVVRLLGGPRSMNGTVNGTISAGAGQPVAVQVPITVTVKR